jgi:RNA polymerase sigma-70 factor (sigma-E family)
VTFEEYLDSKGPGLLRHAVVLTADPHEAEDLVQTVLERAYHRWTTVAALDYPDAYLRRMVTNEFISLRRRLGRIFVVDRVPEPAAVADLADQEVDRQALIGEIRRLPSKQRAAIALRYWGDLSFAQIAEQLNCSEVSARGYIWRATRALRLTLDDSDDPSESAPLTIAQEKP